MSENLRYRGCESQKNENDKTAIFPPTYIVMQFSKNIKLETAQWLIDKVHQDRKSGGAELLIRRQPQLSDDVSQISFIFV